MTMEFDIYTRPGGVSGITGDVLSEAMPWIKNITGKTIVIKYGGAAMVDKSLRDAVMADIVLLKIIGVNLVIVHGGGKAISSALEHEGHDVNFINGQRVTDDLTMDVVRAVLAGQVNQELVAAVNRHGNLAVGINGVDAGIMVAEQANSELGRVGSITRISSALIEDLISSDYIPVIASMAMGEDSGFYNINADVAAGYIAAAIGAHKVIFLSDIDGFYVDYPDKNTFVSRMTVADAREIVKAGQISSGMIPKLESCIRALESGVHRAHIVNGTTPHALLLELLTDKGIGTMITGDTIPKNFDIAPLGNFASKLVENRGR